MADEKAFSHITVSADDEDDIVIQAGARTEPSGAVPEPVTAVDEPEVPIAEPDEPLPAEDAAAGDAPDAGGQDDARPEREGSYREQQLEDLASAPMPAAQKAVLAVALLLIVGFAVYYFFFMR
ncbi:SURF2 Surfeit locus protein 2 [Gordonibacter sp. 28C]|uniref:SURF2 Surfeit locus protein 2 n=1 Tax=Gordonibacter sp. 28C TaxID=2078569 RepID=UPI000DF791A3|nr:SURF2 Surfeit locus protein 2 [Gordonibacter sp. 28C]RDB60395.1 SURF2 Surfeit locus protein 2 [Gordonibacter sp. 28C]